MEGGRSSITKVDLDALMGKYGVTSQEQRERMQALNRGAREHGWWDDYRADLPPTYLTYVGYEAGASFMRQFQSSALPALLQTAEYAQEISAAATADDPVVIASAVKLRLLRQAELAKRTPPPRQHFVLDEAVVRRHAGVENDPAIMPRQLRHLVNRTREDGLITIRIIPFSAGAHAGLTGPFTLLEFEGGLPDILYMDTGRNVITMISGDDPRVGEYADVFEKLLEKALSPAESAELILNVAEEMS